MVDLRTGATSSARTPIYFTTLEPLRLQESNTGSKTCLWFCITLITLIFMIMAIIVIAKSSQRRVPLSDIIIDNIDVEAWKTANDGLLKTLANLKQR